MGRCIDLTNQTFGKLTVLKRVENKNGRSRWLCQCSCGRTTEVDGANLRSGMTHSCGCLRSKGVRPSKNLVNQRFGRLVALEKINKSGPAIWKCQCDCRNLVNVMAQHLQSKNTLSCGCVKSSIGEENIATVLSQNNIVFKREYKISDLGQLRYDFYLPDYHRLIEFDGEQHFKPIDYFGGLEHFQYVQKNDLIKNNYAAQHNISLVRIPYWERDNITLDIIIGDKYLI